MQKIKVTEDLNSFFLIVVKNLRIPRFREINPLAEWITNPTLNSILKYRKHPKVIAIRDLNIRSYFQFSLVSDDEVLNEIKKLAPRKAALRTYNIRSPLLHRIPVFW